MNLSLRERIWGRRRMQWAIFLSYLVMGLSYLITLYGAFILHSSRVTIAVVVGYVLANIPLWLALYWWMRYTR